MLIEEKPKLQDETVARGGLAQAPLIPPGSTRLGPRESGQSLRRVELGRGYTPGPGFQGAASLMKEEERVMSGDISNDRAPWEESQQERGATRKGATASKRAHATVGGDVGGHGGDKPREAQSAGLSADIICFQCEGVPLPEWQCFEEYNPNSICIIELSLNKMSYILDPLSADPHERTINYIQNLPHNKGNSFESPVDININAMEKINLPPLSWPNYDTLPRKMKITNTGHTIILSGKWEKERPFITSGPLTGKYAFSQLHFHWGVDENEGSEHTVDGKQYPLEMHVVHFKSTYLTQESALKEKDGMCVLAYFFTLQNAPNPALDSMVNAIPNIRSSHMSSVLEPAPIKSLVKPFHNDYFMYWGSVATATCVHLLLWMVSREPIGISKEQMAAFRSLLDPYNDPLVRNYRPVQNDKKAQMFHVNPRKHDTLLPAATSLASLYNMKNRLAD